MLTSQRRPWNLFKGRSPSHDRRGPPWIVPFALYVKQGMQLVFIWDWGWNMAAIGSEFHRS